MSGILHKPKKKKNNSFLRNVDLQKISVEEKDKMIWSLFQQIEEQKERIESLQSQMEFFVGMKNKK